MFKKICLVTFFLTTFLTIFPQEANYNLSQDAVISLITMEPSSQSKNQYGHSAIRIFDLNNNIDEVFDLCFYDKHTHLSYKMHSRFIDALKKDQLSYSRNWYEQELNLNHEEKKKVFELLILSCNGPYYGFTENFLTESSPIKILSMLKLILGEKLKLQSGNLTLRTILNNDYTSQSSLFINNIFFGANSDNPKLTLDSCYTAEQLKILASNSKLKITDDIEESLVINERLLVNTDNSTNIAQLFTNKTTIIIFSTLLSLVLILTIVQFYLNSKEISPKSFLISVKAIELAFFVSVGLTGMIILTNDCLSKNILYNNNFNFLWLFPVNLIMAFSLLKTDKNIYISFYWLFCILCTITFMTLCYFKVINQHLSIVNILLINIINVRCIYHFIRFYPFKTKKPVLNQEPAILN